MIGVFVKHGNFAPGARVNSLLSSDSATFDTLEQMKLTNISFPFYGNLCEEYYTPLDGSATLMSRSGGSVGFVSRETSDENGDFLSPIVLTIETNERYTAPGISFTFDENGGVWATDISVKWYNDDTVLAESSFSPDAVNFFCPEQVVAFNRVEITFNSINIPFGRLRVHSFEFGFGTSFGRDELRSVSVGMSLDPISATLPANTFDLVIDTKRNDILFQPEQPMEVYFDDNKIIGGYVRSYNRQSRNVWSVKCEDYISQLEKYVFFGGIYESKNAVTLITEILTATDVPYSISSDFENETVTGYIPYTDCRQALMQVAFAIGAVVVSGYSDGLEIKKLDSTTQKNVPLERIMQGQNFTKDEGITGVELVGHEYERTEETVLAYSARESGTGNGILVVFDEPLYGLEITNGTINSSSETYANIDAKARCVLIGKKISESKFSKRLLSQSVPVNITPKVQKIETATLISPENIDSTLNRCYNYLVNDFKTNLEIVEAKHEKKPDPYIYDTGLIYDTGILYDSYDYDSPREILTDEQIEIGDYINAETEYLGTVSGFVESQNFTLNGNIVVKDTVLR